MQPKQQESRLSCGIATLGPYGAMTVRNSRGFRRQEGSSPFAQTFCFLVVNPRQKTCPPDTDKVGNDNK